MNKLGIKIFKLLIIKTILSTIQYILFAKKNDPSSTTGGVCAKIVITKTQNLSVLFKILDYVEDDEIKTFESKTAFRILLKTALR